MGTKAVRSALKVTLVLGSASVAWGQDSRRYREDGFLKMVIGTKFGADRIKADLWNIWKKVV